MTSLILLSSLDENRNCVQNGNHMQYKNMNFYSNIKKHVVAHSKKIVQLLYSILYMKKI